MVRCEASRCYLPRSQLLGLWRQSHCLDDHAPETVGCTVGCRALLRRGRQISGAALDKLAGTKGTARSATQALFLSLRATLCRCMARLAGRRKTQFAVPVLTPDADINLNQRISLRRRGGHRIIARVRVVAEG